MAVENNPSLYVQKSVLKSEDWWAVWLGLLVFALGIGPIWGLNLLGWVPKYNVWLDISKAFDPNAKAYAVLGPWGSAIITYLFRLCYNKKLIFLIYLRSLHILTYNIYKEVMKDDYNQDALDIINKLTTFEQESLNSWVQWSFNEVFKQLSCLEQLYKLFQENRYRKEKHFLTFVLTTLKAERRKEVSAGAAILLVT